MKTREPKNTKSDRFTIRDQRAKYSIQVLIARYFPTPYPAGFTLIEVLVSLSILGVILLAVMRLQQTFMDQQDFTVTSYLSVETANRVAEELARELRNARNGDNGAYLLAQAADNAITFYGNADRDVAMERIRYFQDGTDLKKGVIDPSTYPITYPTATETITVVAQNLRNTVSTPLFTYYNGNWPTDTTNNPLPSAQRLLNTRAVRIHILINANDADLKNDYEVKSVVQIRTIKDNLSSGMSTPGPTASPSPSPTPSPTPAPTATPTPAPTSCAQYCSQHGYPISGICRRNQFYCTANGEVNLSGGNYLCTGGSNADTCCCK